MTITVAEMLTRVRAQSDRPSATGFIPDSEALDFMRSEWYDLYDLLINKFGEEFVTVESTVITLVANTKNYSLPSDFAKLRGVDVVISGDTRRTLGRFMWEDRNLDPYFVYETVLGAPTGYALMGDQIYLVPAPDSSGSMYLWYVSNTGGKLVTGAPGAGEINQLPAYVMPGWDDFIVDGAVARIHLKQHDAELAMVFEARKEALRKRIISRTKSRDANRPSEVRLVRRRRRF
jgi:hypothetical protein